MIRPPFVFERRFKHPAHNATNALLNLGYVLRHETGLKNWPDPSSVSIP